MHAFKTVAPGFVPPELRPSAREPVPYRMLMVGVQGAGKYSLHHQFIYSCFPKLRDPFFETEATEILWKSEENKTLTFRIDPTRMNISRPGESMASEHLYPDFRLPVDMFRFADNQGMILVYSITSRTSFAALESFVEARIREKRSGQVEPKVLCLVGNKLDCSRQGRKVLCIEAEELAAKIGCPFVECSAKDGKELAKVKNATLKGMDAQRPTLIKIGGETDKKVRASSARSPSMTGGLFRRFSEASRSDTQRSLSPSEQEQSSQLPSATRWKHAAASSPLNQKTTLSHSQMGARIPASRTLSATTRIDEEDESTEESRSSSQQSSNQSLGSTNTVTPPSNGTGPATPFQPRPRLDRVNSRSGARVLTKDPPRSHAFQAPQKLIPEKGNEVTITSKGSLTGSQASQLLGKIDEIKRNETTDPSPGIGARSQTTQAVQQIGYTNGKSAIVTPSETITRSQSSHEVPKINQGNVNGSIMAPSRSPTDRESFSERYAFIHRALAVKPPTEQPAEEIVQSPLQSPRISMESQTRDPFGSHEITMGGQVQSPVQEPKVALEQRVTSPAQYTKSVDDQFRSPVHEEKGPHIEQVQSVQSVQSPVQEHNELEDARARLESEKKKLEDQMKALEEQAKLLDERKKKGEEQRRKDEKEKRRQEKKVLLDKQESEKQHLLRKQKLEREALEALHKEELSKFQDLDDEVGPRAGPRIKVNNGVRSATSPTPTREASKFLQQKAIDHIWDRPIPPAPPTVIRRQSAQASTASKEQPNNASLELRSQQPILRRQSTQASTISREQPSNVSEEPGPQPPVLRRQSTQASTSSTASTTNTTTNERPVSPVSIETSNPRAAAPQRPTMHLRRNSIGVTPPGQVASLGTLFTLKNAKTTPKVPTQKGHGSTWTRSHPRLPFPGKYI